jgi:hypothetical protein
MRAPRSSLGPAFVATARAAVTDLRASLERRAPELARELVAWLASLAPGGSAHAYFLSDWGFPLLELPWLIGAGSRRRSAAFERDIARSSMSGYYAIRLMDDALDGDAPPTAERLLWLGLLQAEFQTPYALHLGHDRSFWEAFADDWCGGLDATQRDASSKSFDFEAFVAVASRKTRAARIPVRAAISFYGREAELRGWLELCDVLGRFVQFADDLLDWPADLARAKASTYFLSEGQRRKRRRETVPEWVAREGLAWGASLCFEWLDELEALAKKLRSPPLTRVLRSRRVGLEKYLFEMQTSLGELAPLMASYPLAGRLYSRT